MVFKSVLFFLVVILLGEGGCTTPINNRVPENNLSATSITTVATSHPLDGYWILTDYLDSILKEKAIAKHRFYVPAVSAISLHILNDTLFHSGLINQEILKAGRSADSSLFTLEDENSTLVLRYDRQSDKIEARNMTMKSNDEFKARTFIYRRVTEKYLLDILNKNYVMDIRKGFHQLFMDSLLPGEYRSLKNGEKLVLTGNGLVKGFRSFNAFDIQDYFGTMNVFQDYDAVCFEDTTKNSPNSQGEAKVERCYYHWSFSGDTLSFVEMIRDKGDDYFLLGKKTYQFVSIKK